MMIVEYEERRWATVSGDERYRYTLGRRWAQFGDNVCWIMLNPSTADGTKDDHTIRKCRGFSQRLGAAGMSVVNLFALRATDPRELVRATDPVGPDNDAAIRSAVATAGWVIAAWGNDGSLLNRELLVVSMIEQATDRPLYRLGSLTRSHHPRHPRTLGYDTPLEVYRMNTLFDIGPAPPEAPAKKLSATQRLTIRNRELLDHGVHPATRVALLDPEWGYTCGDCAHHVAYAHDRVWHKCDRHRLGLSHSAASDIRVSWPACGKFRIDPWHVA